MATYTIVETFRKYVWPVTEQACPERIITKAAEIAYKLINAKLYGYYSVPFASTPDLILEISDILTKHFAIVLASRQSTPVVVEDEDPGGRSLYSAAMAMLKDLKTGDSELPGENRSTAKASYVPHYDKMPIFNLDDELSHALDEEQLEEIEDERYY